MLTEKQEKRIAEQRRGMNVSMRNMCNGIVELIQSEIDPTKKYSFLLAEEGGDDFRFWDVEVSVRSSGEVIHREPFGQFPSNELKTVILLMGA